MIGFAHSPPNLAAVDGEDELIDPALRKQKESPPVGSPPGEGTGVPTTKENVTDDQH
ncbi:hypothetical protein [Streptomyces flaveus]|uniref:Uncharacterized protein n=1 Tax=Streptomyces flaveus TaxID=66370 RepID=A0A917RAY5_9ACTN|nr:hypothetical protein [Streptomyces flaveus]GGK98285.1 hypothetical protein GCM10010094_68950 [Streptomyces flaveus]